MRDRRQTIENGQHLGGEIAGPWREAALEQYGSDGKTIDARIIKECDLIVTRGDLLHYTTLVEWAVVDGRIVYDKERDSLLRHIRPRELDGGNFEVPQLWPRQGGPQPDVPERDW